MRHKFRKLRLWLLLIFIIIFEFNHINKTNSTSMSSSKFISNQYRKNLFTSDCGIQIYRESSINEQQDPLDINNTVDFIRNKNRLRTSKIISGTYTKDGQFPWQASLELLHPSLGFLGHWCGAVLIHQYWVLSAAHCIHNDLFNLPLPPLWTVVLGEYDRTIESGYEQRIPIEKIVLHKQYENFLHDLVLLKLSMPANLSPKSNIRNICLPVLYETMNPIDNLHTVVVDDINDSLLIDKPNFDIFDVSDKMENFLRSVQTMKHYANITIPTMKQLMDLKIWNRLKRINLLKKPIKSNTFVSEQRRNDKFINYLSKQCQSNKKEEQLKTKTNKKNEREKDNQKEDKTNNEYENKQFLRRILIDNIPIEDLHYVGCVATGWGKANITGDLTDLLLKTTVPLHNNRRCREAYGSFVHIHRGHLCAGKLTGKGGTCVGDSGGPLQCRLKKDGPWVLAGITSFGSGCAIEGYPDVYVRISHYVKWIQDTITYE